MQARRLALVRDGWMIRLGDWDVCGCSLSEKHLFQEGSEVGSSIALGFGCVPRYLDENRDVGTCDQSLFHHIHALDFGVSMSP
jgi:hypothetical protein